jgi:hypothetical protein
MSPETVSFREELHSMKLVFKVSQLTQVKDLCLLCCIMNSETLYEHFIGLSGQDWPISMIRPLQDITTDHSSFHP